VPYTFEPVGRTNSEEHNRADVKVTPLKVDQPLKRVNLPVAAMTLHAGEVWAAYRAKKRPCLVLGSETPEVDKSVTRGMPKVSSAPTVLVAPYYGADQDGKRAGYKPEFVERIRHCDYPQFLWDQLPISGANESILRLDHTQPIGTHHNSYKLSEYRLSEEAMEIIDELIEWVVWGGVDEDSYVAMYRQTIEETFEK
ncbi:MAG: hypothetical protein ACH254_20945, partial [Candidatus Thiodiazotropha endolucinida]